VSAVRTLVVAVIAALLWSSVLAASDPAPGALPRPARASFDLARANLTLQGAFAPFIVSDTVPLRDALTRGLVARDTDLLLTDTAAGSLALLVEQMAYHHIAQGRAASQDWLVSFCVVCNTGTRLSPIVNGKADRFETAGIYDGTLVMRDTATGSIWDHITGEALYGSATGATLGEPGGVLQVTVKQALTMQPDARIAISDRIYFANGRRHGTQEGISLLARTHARPGTTGAALSDAFVATLGREDTRRPRMDLGLGIWSATGSRYYPRDLIQQRGDALIDDVDGRHVLVYIDPDTSTPAALFVSANRATVHGSTIRLDTGQTLRAGVLLDRSGRRITVERPLQVFTRWYGFALTFPGTAIYAARPF
jgi:hypothetical protein